MCGPFRAQNLMAWFLASAAPWLVIAGQVLIVRGPLQLPPSGEANCQQGFVDAPIQHWGPPEAREPWRGDGPAPCVQREQSLMTR